MPQLLKTCRRTTNDDEFYTQMKDVEKEFQHWDLTGKKIICPCDTVNSNIYKYMKEHNYMVDNESIEWRNVDYSKYDIVITNPPFSQRKEFLNYLISIKKDFIIVVSDSYIWSLKKNKSHLPIDIYVGRDLQKFIRPNGELSRIHAGWISNIQDTTKQHKIIKPQERENNYGNNKESEAN